MVLTVAVTEMALVYKLKHLNKTDSYLIQLQHQLCDDPDSMPHFTFQEGLLLFRKRLIIPPDPALKRLLLEEFHSSNIGGHAGIAWSFLRLSSNFFWLGMRKDVKQFVLQCQVFQQMKDTHSKPAGLLLPIPIPVSIFEDISMDFITGLPPSQGRTVILVIGDRDDTSNPDVIESLCRRDETLSLLKSNLQAAEERMKSNADKGRKDGLPPSEATWEDLPTLTHQFPDLNLEDKVRLHRGGNVTNPQDHSSTLRRSSRDKQSPKYLVEYVVPKDNRGPLPLSNTAAHIAPACQETSK
ncbi:hypothetical protein FXO38_17280 [Capsicum annuum]|nr:hypothetical protein FXO38_17280 [Capsicum annuum]